MDSHSLLNHPIFKSLFSPGQYRVLLLLFCKIAMSPSFISTIRATMKRSNSTRTAPTSTPIFCNYTPPTRPTATVVQPQLRASLKDESAQPTPDVLILRSFRRMSYTQTAPVYEPLW
ncbi:hypothetical protein DFH06DRAFT_1345122 [Mycena polygramma]|nr:hypothetical protein DFH06DRAFT_1345122 [Mycena polygramma]